MHIDFSNGLLTGLPNKSYKALQHVQNMSAKVMLNKSYRESSTECMLELHWLKVEYRILYKTLITVHNCLSGKALDYLKKKYNFKQSSEGYALRSTKESNMLEVPKTKCISYGDRAFSVYGAHQWNLLPSELRCKEDIPTFKKSLKQHDEHLISKFLNFLFFLVCCTASLIACECIIVCFIKL